MEHDEFAVDLSYVDDVLVMAVRGELDVVSSPLLRAELERHAPGEHVVVDCSDMLFIDSAGLELLISQAHRRELSGGSLRLRNCVFPVRQVVELIGLIYLFELDNGDGTPDLGDPAAVTNPTRFAPVPCRGSSPGDGRSIDEGRRLTTTSRG